MLINAPNNVQLDIKNIVLDLNGTLANYGIISEETKELIQKLKALNYRIILISGDIRGNAATIAKELGIDLLLGKNSNEKAKQIQKFNSNNTAAIGNARIDIGTFQNAILSIATLQQEGIHTDIIKYVDIIVPSIEDALRLFIDTKSIEGTLRI